MTRFWTSLTAAGSALFLGVVLTACSSAAMPAGSAPTAVPSPSGTTPTTGSTDAAIAPVDARKIAAHVHNLAIEGQDVYLGTHEGLFRHAPGQPLVRISDQPFDVMGLVRAPDGWLASGHPGDGMDAPADLGLLASADGGVSWTPRSLYGEVDFHRLTASGSTVLGLSAHDGALLRSTDAGSTWTNLGTPPLFDLAVSPQNPDVVVGTTRDGPVVSADGGTTFAPISGAPLVALLAWDRAELVAVDPDGRVLRSTDNGVTWIVRGSVPGQPVALAAGGGTVAVLAGETVHFSADGGTTFHPRITGLGGH